MQESVNHPNGRIPEIGETLERTLRASSVGGTAAILGSMSDRNLDPTQEQGESACIDQDQLHPGVKTVNHVD